MKIGITGATGQLGKIVVNKLKAKVSAANLVALVRSPEKAADLGVEARLFDYNTPDGLAASLSGIDSLLLISGNEPGARLRQHTSVIEAAKNAGVKHIVYTSLLRADSTTLVLGPEHLGTEKLVIASGIPYTILRNGWYFENYFSGLSHVASSGELFGSAGEGKISAATREDYAEAAVVALTTTGHENKIYELAGDSSFTLSDLAKTVGDVSGKPVVYKNLPVNEFAATLESAGLPQGIAQFLAGFHVPTEKGELYDGGRQLSTLIGRPTTSLKDAVAVALQAN